MLGKSLSNVISLCSVKTGIAKGTLGVGLANCDGWLLACLTNDTLNQWMSS